MDECDPEHGNGKHDIDDHDSGHDGSLSTAGGESQHHGERAVPGNVQTSSPGRGVALPQLIFYTAEQADQEGWTVVFR